MKGLPVTVNQRLKGLSKLLGLIVFAWSLGAYAAAERPNILWITCEDTSPLLGCYGDEYATTPNLDAFAKESVRYLNAFAYTGVCSPSRSCLITGVYPVRLGSHPMRSTTRLPHMVKCFSEYLREAGYYCANNVKTDYNFATPKEAWDESSGKAHWRKRQPGQPFFAVFNFMVSHQSQIFAADMKAASEGKEPPPTEHDQAKVPVPPIHPDTPEFRREWARHYDNVTKMDAQAGKVLKELAEDGLADDTIVFFYSDHGTGMPAIKMWAWDASLRVPLMIRFPKNWESFAPAKPGETESRLVSFVDFAPTVLSLSGVKVPSHMQGAAFLGGQEGERHRYIFGGKDRQGERFDIIRYAHDGKYQYLRNFEPHLPWSQFISYVDQHASMRSWDKLHEAGKLTGAPARFFQTKPMEELYDVENDPWETNNLAADPQMLKTLDRLRTACRNWMIKTGDLGLLPEEEMHRRSHGTSPYEIALDTRYNPLKKLLAAAEIANQRDPKNLKRLERLLEEKDAAIRWWGAQGMVALGEKAAPSKQAVMHASRDASWDVRVAAAEALAAMGELDRTLEVLREALKVKSPFIRLAAINVADRLGSRAKPLLPDIAQANIQDAKNKDAASYVGRMVDYVPDRINRN